MLRHRRHLVAVLAATALLAPAGAASASDCPGADVHPVAGNLYEVGQATLCLLNVERSQAGLVPLREDALLTLASTGFANLMVQEQFFAHVSPEGSTFVDRLKDVGYLPGAGAWTAGENLAWGTGTYATPAAIVDAWMHSPGHRANILNGDFHEIGLGVALGDPGTSDQSDGATYATDFGTREEPAVASVSASPKTLPVKRHRSHSARSHRSHRGTHAGRHSRHRHHHRHRGRHTRHARHARGHR